jgi:chromosome segregation ATPase
MATFADDMAELQQAKADVGQQLECLAAQHGQLQARHSTATTQLEQSQQEMQHMRS